MSSAKRRALPGEWKTPDRPRPDPPPAPPEAGAAASPAPAPAAAAAAAGAPAAAPPPPPKPPEPDPWDPAEVDRATETLYAECEQAGAVLVKFVVKQPKKKGGPPTYTWKVTRLSDDGQVLGYRQRKGTLRGLPPRIDTLMAVVCDAAAALAAEQVGGGPAAAPAHAPGPPPLAAVPPPPEPMDVSGDDAHVQGAGIELPAAAGAAAAADVAQEAPTPADSVAGEPPGDGGDPPEPPAPTRLGDPRSAAATTRHRYSPATPASVEKRSLSPNRTSPPHHILFFHFIFVGHRVPLASKIG